MNILAVNGGPRRHWNTEQILEHVLAGAMEGASADGAARGETVQLYPMRYSGCIGCYGCKRKGGPSALCQYKDALTPILEKAQEADVLLLATPVYFFTESAGLRAFIERLLYPWSAFNPDGYGSRRPKPMAAGFIYTLAGTPESVAAHGHAHFSDSTRQFLSLHFPRYECLFAYNTLHTEDYGKLELNVFDPVERRKSREERFPADCAEARDMGRTLAAAVRGGL